MRTEPILLVHGFGSSFAHNWELPGWVDLIKDAGRSVVAVDLLGHGQAPKPHEPEAYDHMEDRILDALPAEPVDAVGFSMGATLLLRVVARDPSRFGRVVVGGIGGGERSDDVSGSPMESIAQAIEGDGQPGEAGSIGRAFATFAAGAGNDPAALAACMRRAPAPLSRDELSRITVPVLVVLGDKDFTWPADALVDALPDARLKALPGADHFGTPKDFRFIDATLTFLDAVPA